MLTRNPTWKSLSNRYFHSLYHVNGVNNTSTAYGHLPIKSVILPWEGVTVDPCHTSQIVSLVRAFRQQDLTLSEQQIWLATEHNCSRFLRKIQKDPSWLTHRLNYVGVLPPSININLLTNDFVRNQVVRIAEYCELVPELLEITEELQYTHDLHIVATTDLDSEVAEIVEEEALVQNYQPWLAQTRYLSEGLFPWLEVGPEDLWPEQVVVVSDDRAVVEMGRHLGYWTVGITNSPKTLLYPDLSHPGIPMMLESRDHVQRKNLDRGQPDFVIPDLYGLPEVINDINSITY